MRYAGLPLSLSAQMLKESENHPKKRRLFARSCFSRVTDGPLSLLREGLERNLREKQVICLRSQLSEGKGRELTRLRPFAEDACGLALKPFECE